MEVGHDADGEESQCRYRNSKCGEGSRRGVWGRDADAVVDNADP